MPDTNRWPQVEENGFCGHFERIDLSLIEEPETCDVCRFYCGVDSSCRYPQVQQ